MEKQSFGMKASLLLVCSFATVWVVACGQAKSSLAPGAKKNPSDLAQAESGNNPTNQGPSTPENPAGLVQLDPNKALLTTDVTLSPDSLKAKAQAKIDSKDEKQVAANAGVVKAVCSVIVDPLLTSKKETPARIHIFMRDKDGKCNIGSGEVLELNGTLDANRTATLGLAAEAALAADAKTATATLTCQDQIVENCNATTALINFARPNLSGKLAVVSRIYSDVKLQSLTDVTKMTNPSPALLAFKKRMDSFIAAQTTDAKANQALFVKTTEIIHGSTFIRVMMGQADSEALDLTGYLVQQTADAKTVTGLLRPRPFPFLSNVMTSWMAALKIDSSKVTMSSQGTVNKYLLQGELSKESLIVQAEFVQTSEHAMAPQVLNYQMTMMPVLVVQDADAQQAAPTPTPSPTPSPAPSSTPNP